MFGLSACVCGFAGLATGSHHAERSVGRVLHACVIDADSCWILCRRPWVVRMLAPCLQGIALLLARQLSLPLHLLAKLNASCYVRCEYVCVSSIAVVHSLQFVVLHFVNCIVFLQCPHCKSCSVFFCRFCHAYQPYMLVFVIQLAHRSVSV